MTEASSLSGLLRSPLLISAVGSYVTADSATNVFRLARTGWAMRAAAATDSVSLPVEISNEGGVSYVVPVEPAATAAVAAFLAGQPLSTP